MTTSRNIKTICVFCGGDPKMAQKHLDTGYQLGEILADNNIGLIYGGGNKGVMGALAEGILSRGGTLTGVFPLVLKDIAEKHPTLSKTMLTDTMHERKQCMYNQADAFVTLAGGFGTMDETVETIVWKQIGLHNKPLVICNAYNYWNHLIEITRHFMHENALHSRTQELYSIADNVEDILAILEQN